MKKHWVAILLSVLVGIIYIAPDLTLMMQPGYAGLPLVYTDAEPWYLTRLEGVYKGCAVSCNPYIKEYGSNFPFFDASVSETILAFPGIVLGFSVATLKLIYLFLLPAVLFFLVYLLIWRLTKGKLVSLLGASLILFGFNLINSQMFINAPAVFNIFKWQTDQVQFLLYSRLVNPQFSSIYFFVFLHVLFSAIEKKTKRSYILLTVLFGVSFYIYFFTYAFISVLLLVSGAAYLLKKDWQSVRNYLLVFAGGLIVGSYQILEIFKVLKHPYYLTIPHDYLIKTHVPDISLVGVLLLLIFTILIYVEYKKGTLSVSLFFVSILGVGAFLARNEHVLTGMVMQYTHFESYYFTPVLIIAICYFLHPYVTQASKWLFGILIAFVFINGIVIQQNSDSYWRDHALNSQKYMPVISWLNTWPPGQVIDGTDPLLSFVTSFTPHYVTWSFYAGQWISVPGRATEHQHGVNYYIEDTMRDKLKGKLPKVYSDQYFTVYHNQ